MPKPYTPQLPQLPAGGICLPNVLALKASRAAFERLERRQPACVGKDCNVEPRNELEMGTEACRLKMILGWA